MFQYIYEARNGTGRNKLRTYRRFKNEYKREKYVDVILPRHNRSALCKVPIWSVAPLRLETGRYERIEERDRICFSFDSQIETEHVLTECPLYLDLRETLYEKISQFKPNFLEIPSSEKVNFIPGCDMTPVIRASAKICHDILTVRRQFFIDNVYNSFKYLYYVTTNHWICTRCVPWEDRSRGRGHDVWTLVSAKCPLLSAV